ncbi:MAG TPA: translation initiation factor IF-2 [Ktedonobacterales bacterium]|nr:translation initiation factor IF-2 [Ktedonobacterales bacterium]
MKQHPADFEQTEGSEKELRSNPTSRSPQRRPSGGATSPTPPADAPARSMGQGSAAGGTYPARPVNQHPPMNRPASGSPSARQTPGPDAANRPSSGGPSFRPSDAPSRPASGGASFRPNPSGGFRPAQGGFGGRPAPTGGQSRNGSGGSGPGARRPSGPGSSGRPQTGRSGQRHNDRRSSGGPPTNGQGRAAVAVKPRPTEPVAIPPQIPVRDLAALLEVAPMEVIRELFKHNILANINQVITYDSAAMVAKELGYETLEAAPPPTQSAQKHEVAPHHEAHLVHRPPVVTVMGHVDHGKTSLLDTIRKTRVAAGEAGGITQHIGAYQVEVNGKKITFLDTPGHEAFTAMRARGAQVTDIAVIVVAADDGVMPQTLEAIDHARAAKVPIIVALNKMDKPGANPDHVKSQLADAGVVIEEYGGDVVCVPVSAKKNTGIDELLEMILLVAEVQDLKANPQAKALGTIIESRLDKNRGVSATVLMEQGTLKVGDIVVVGAIFGRVRAMFDDKGKQIKKAVPSVPVEILGLPEVPRAGDRLEEVADEKIARSVANQRAQLQKVESAGGTRAISLDSLSSEIQAGKVKELNLLIKADVRGSLEAIKPMLERLGEETTKVRILHDGVGNISETDIHLASASNAVIIGFNVKIDPAAQRLAQNEGVDIRSYDVIYKLGDDIEAALKGMLEPTYREQVDGHAEVLQLFKVGKTTVIAGCRITDGKLMRSSQARVLRGGKVILTGQSASLRRGKDDVREVASGFECGVTLEDFNQFEVGDVIEAFSKVRA